MNFTTNYTKINARIVLETLLRHVDNPLFFPDYAAYFYSKDRLFVGSTKGRKPGSIKEFTKYDTYYRIFI